MITEQEKSTVVRTWRLVVPIADTAADLFYGRLFEIAPQYKPYFKSDMKSQKKKLLMMLSFVVRSLDWAEAQWRDDVAVDEDLFLVIAALGKRHTSLYKIPNESYDSVGQALIWTLAQGLGDAFTDDVKEAWVKVYTLLARSMQLAGEAREIGDVELGLLRA